MSTKKSKKAPKSRRIEVAMKVARCKALINHQYIHNLYTYTPICKLYIRPRVRIYAPARLLGG